MHEIAFAKEVIFHIKAASSGRFPAGVISANVSLSPFSHVSAEGLLATVELLAEIEGIKGLKLKVRSMPLLAFCRGCKNNFKVNKATFHCPRCLSTDIDIKKDREFMVDSIEIEQKD